MKQILNIYFKDGSKRHIKCSWFTFTSTNELVIAYQNEETQKIHNEIIDMNEIEFFGGNPSYENQ